MTFISQTRTFLQAAWGMAPITVVCLAVFLRCGIYEYPLAAIVALIDLTEHIVLNRGWYFEVTKVLVIVSLILYLASLCILLAYSTIGREHRKLSEEIQRLKEKYARLESKTENMKGHRDSILEDYSVQSATLTTMTDRAVMAECRLTEYKNDFEAANETAAKVTRLYDLCENSKEFLLVKLQGYDRCRADLECYKENAKSYKADAERYKGYQKFKADAERFQCDAERFQYDAACLGCEVERLKRVVQHHKQKARIAEEDCSANVYEFSIQKKALEEEVEALKAEIQTDCLGEGGEEKARSGENKAGRLEDAKIKKIKALEQKIENLETDIENLEDSQETTKAAYEMEINGHKATIHEFMEELKDVREELDVYKEDNDERSKTIQELLGFRREQQKELEDVKQKLALAELAVKIANSKSGGDDGDGEASPSNSLSGTGPSGAGQPGPSNIPSASGDDGDGETSPSNSPSGAGSSGAGQPDPSNIPSASGDDGDGEASPSNPPSGAGLSDAGQPGPSILPSASGSDQVPKNLSNFFGSSPLPPDPPMDPAQCPQS